MEETPKTGNVIDTLEELQLSLRKLEEQTRTSKVGRDVSLQQELEQLTQINSVIAKLSQSLDLTEESVHGMINHTEQSNGLLTLWIKILSQNHHTYRLLKDKENWKGRTDFELHHELKLAQLHALELELKQKRSVRHKKGLN